KSHGESHAADRLLPDAYGGLVLPLVVFALVGAVVISTSLRASLFPVTAIGAACYASFFVFGSSFGKTGAGRMLLLVVDWLLGSAGGPLEILTPRAHLRNLLGGAPLAHASQTASAITL